MADQEKICEICGKPKMAYALCIGWYPVNCDCVEFCPDCRGTGLQKHFALEDGIYHKPACKTCHAKGVIEK